MNQELPDVQAGFRKGRGTRDQIANIQWMTEKARGFQKNIYFCFIDYAKAFEKARGFQKNIYFCFIDYAKAFDYVDHNKLENSSGDGNTSPPYLPPKKSVCKCRSNS